MNNGRRALCHEKEKCTYDQMADDYGVNKFYIWMYINVPGYQPPRKIKRKLGLIPKRPRRVAIRCDNMTSAANTIRNNLAPEQVRELVERLEVNDG